MGIDTSIYASLKPVEMPSMLDSAQRAMSLSQMSLQNQGMARQMADDQSLRAAFADNTGADGQPNMQGALSQLYKTAPMKAIQLQQQQSAMNKERAESQKAQIEAAHQIATVTVPAYGRLLKMSDEQAAQEYPATLQYLAQQGVPNVDKMPPSFDRHLIEIGHHLAGQHKEILDAEKTKTEIAKIKFDMGKISPEQTKELSEAGSVDKTLKDMSDVIGSNREVMGPWSGRVNQMAGVVPGMDSKDAERVHTLQAQLSAGGVDWVKRYEGQNYRPGNEKLYQEILPKVTDKPDVAANKVQIMTRMSAQRQADQIRSLSNAGYNTAPITSSGQPQVPSLPKTLTEGRVAKTKEGVAFAGESGPHGPTVNQGGYTYSWNPKTKQYE